MDNQSRVYSTPHTVTADKGTSNPQDPEKKKQVRNNDNGNELYLCFLDLLST